MITHSIAFGELKQIYIDAVEEKTVCKRIRNQSKLTGLVNSWSRKSNNYGPSSKDLIGWLHNGYKIEGFTLEPPVQPVKKRRRLMYADEGELQLDLAWSGHDYPFLAWTQRETLPGMKIDILYSFQWGTKVEVIIEYCRFVLRALIALENAGIDLDIGIGAELSNCFSNSRENGYFRVVVKKEGEQTDYLGWSAILSPGGFRHLMFLDIVYGADSKKMDVSYGLGHGTNGSNPWAIDYDVDTRTLKFTTPYHPYNFPEKEMEMQLREVILNARETT